MYHRSVLYKRAIGDGLWQASKQDG